MGRGLAGQGSGACGCNPNPGNLLSCMIPPTPETKRHARAGARPHLPHDNIPIPEWHQVNIRPQECQGEQQHGDKDRCPDASLRWDLGRKACSEVPLPHASSTSSSCPSWSQGFPKAKFYLLPKTASCPPAQPTHAPAKASAQQVPQVTTVPFPTSQGIRPNPAALHCCAHTQPPAPSTCPSPGVSFGCPHPTHAGLSPINECVTPSRPFNIPSPTAHQEALEL